MGFDDVDDVLETWSRMAEADGDQEAWRRIREQLIQDSSCPAEVIEEAAAKLRSLGIIVF